MAKYDFEAAVAFAKQTGEGTFNATLDAIVATLVAADGLILGANGTGIGNSGIDFKIGREYTDQAVISGSFTRAISTWLATNVPTFSFTFPFCGNRIITDPVTDVSCIPITGVDALLSGASMVGTAWGTGVGHRYVFGSPEPISSLLYMSGNRFELLDCRCTLSVAFVAGQVPLATATISVGSIKDHSAAALPATTTYGEQASVSAASAREVGHDWQDIRGFQTLILDITPEIEDIPDSNAATGKVKEASDRSVKITGTMFEDDTADKIMGYTQVSAAAAGTLDQLDFMVGDAALATTPALAVQIIAPQPEAVEYGYAKLGTKSGAEVNLVLRGATANSELEIIFQ